jgi:hypothetical protein
MKLKDSKDDVIGIWNLSSDHNAVYTKRVRCGGKILALNFGPFANGPLVASTSQGEIRMWRAPFKGDGLSLYLEDELDGDDDDIEVGGVVSGLANEPNLSLWSKNDGVFRPRRVDLRPSV